MPTLRPGTGSLIGGLSTAILGSVCCIGPLALVSLGIGGVWIANLRLLEPYKPIFIGVTALFLWFAYRKIYRTADSCQPGTACALPRTQRWMRLLFWFVTLLAIAAFALPYFATLFY